MAETIAEAKITVEADGAAATRSIDEFRNSLRSLSQTPVEAKIAGLHKQFRDLSLGAKSLYDSGKIGFDEYRKFIDDVGRQRGAAVKRIIDEDAAKKANKELEETNRQLAKIKAITAVGAFKGILSDDAGKILDAATSGMVMFGAAGAAVGLALGVVATASDSAKQRVAELNAEFRQSLADAASARKSFEALGQAYREVAAGGGAAATGKVAQVLGGDLDKARTKLDELRASLHELRNAAELQSGLEKAGKGVLEFAGIGDRPIAEKIDEATQALTAQERAVAKLAERYEQAKQAKAQAELGEIRQSLFQAGLNEPEKRIQAEAAQYDELLKKAALLNVTEEERASIIGDINEQRQASLDKLIKEQKHQNDIANKLMGVDQIARSFQAQELAKPKVQARDDVLAKILAGPRIPALEMADKATEANTDATGRLTTSVEALRRGIEVAKGVRIGPGE